MKIIEVSAAIIRDKDKILITKRLGGEFDAMWEFPGLPDHTKLLKFKT